MSRFNSLISTISLMLCYGLAHGGCKRTNVLNVSDLQVRQAYLFGNDAIVSDLKTNSILRLFRNGNRKTLAIEPAGFYSFNLDNNELVYLTGDKDKLKSVAVSIETGVVGRVYEQDAEPLKAMPKPLSRSSFSIYSDTNLLIRKCFEEQIVFGASFSNRQLRSNILFSEATQNAVFISGKNGAFRLCFLTSTRLDEKILPVEVDSLLQLATTKAVLEGQYVYISAIGADGTRIFRVRHEPAMMIEDLCKYEENAYILDVKYPRILLFTGKKLAVLTLSTL